MFASSALPVLAKTSPEPVSTATLVHTDPPKLPDVPFVCLAGTDHQVPSFAPVRCAMAATPPRTSGRSQLEAIPT
jgi:hypothetical protein